MLNSVLRLPRVARSVLLLALTAPVATALTAGAASAATGPTSSVAAATVAAHGLGALVPTTRIAPAAGQMSALAVVPASVDLRKWAVTPGNQGALGSCVTWAIDYAMLGWYAHLDGRVGAPFAPMYTYSQIHIGAGDGGSYPSAALQVATNQGNDTRAHYTQGDYDWSTKPTAAEHTNAAQFKIKGSTTLFSGANQAGTVAALKQALAANHPVAIEMAVRNGFDFLGPGSAAVDDDITTGIRGYHEVLALGYDSAGLLIQNSWGTGWADAGFGRLSWRVVQNDVWEGDTIAGFVAPVTAPKVTAPAGVVVTTTAATAKAAATVTYKLTWKATTGNSGPVTRYDAWSQTDGGANLAVKLTAVTATSFTFVTHVGHTYRFGVRATAGSHSSAVVFSAVIAPKSTAIAK